MKRMGQPLAARVAKLQTWVIALTLLAVTLATAAAVSLLLARKTDQQLESVLARVAYYMREKPALDLAWLAGEVEEVRPLDARVELLDDGAAAGLDKCAEKNELFELKGDATSEKWQPEREVFKDKEHLTRASGQLTLMQTTQLTLEAALSKGEAMKKGTIYSAIPALKDGKTAVTLRVRTAGGHALDIVIDEKSK